MSTEIKNAVESLSVAFEEFKKTNDEKLAQIEKSVTNTADGLVTEKVERINNDITVKLEEYQKVNNKHLEEIESSVKLSIASGQDTGDKAKELNMFNSIAGTEFDIENYGEYKQEFNNYLRKGKISNAMKVGEDPAGGYWVEPNEMGRMVELIYESSPMRQVANVVTISTDALEGPYDLNEVGVGWVGEVSSRSETTTADIGSWRIPVHEIYANPKVTQKLLDDSSVNVEAYLRGKAAEKFGRTENTAFVSGDGNNQPRGFLDYTLSTSDIAAASYGSVLQKVETGVNGGFDASDPGDNIIDLVYALKPQYRPGAVFMMNRSVEAAVRKLQDGQGNYLWQPNFQSMNASSLLGFPIVTAEDMPDLATDSKSIAFGDFRRGYQIVDRQGIRLLRDPFTAKPYVLFYMTKRTGGDVIDFDAIKILEFTA